VGGVGLPALVGLGGLEAEVAGLGTFVRLGGDKAPGRQDPPNRGHGRGGAVPGLEVERDRGGAALVAVLVQVLADLDDLVLEFLTGALRAGQRPPGPWLQPRLGEDVAFRVLAANQSPDHATLARFRRRHQDPIAGVFGQVPGLCVAGGLVDAGVVAIDGTKIAANASAWANRTRKQLAEEILAEADQVDAAEDAELGQRRGDELPGPWSDRRDRPARVQQALGSSRPRAERTLSR
jgi:hypothetical protein